MEKDYFIDMCVKTLKRALKLASRNRDVEALVAISDRWYALMEHAYGQDDNRIPAGFITQEMQSDSGKKSDKRKS